MPEAVVGVVLVPGEEEREARVLSLPLFHLDCVLGFGD